jgi:hypothetical protein
MRQMTSCDKASNICQILTSYAVASNVASDIFQAMTSWDVARNFC